MVFQYAAKRLNQVMQRCTCKKSVYLLDILHKLVSLLRVSCFYHIKKVCFTRVESMKLCVDFLTFLSQQQINQQRQNKHTRVHVKSSFDLCSTMFSTQSCKLLGALVIVSIAIFYPHILYFRDAIGLMQKVKH